jgi:hypothetical protein
MSEQEKPLVTEEELSDWFHWFQIPLTKKSDREIYDFAMRLIAEIWRLRKQGWAGRST